MIWIILLAAVLGIAAVGLAFISSRTLRFGFARKIYSENKKLGRAVSFWPVLLCLPFALINIVTAVVVFVHLVVIWAVCDLIGFVINKLRKRERKGRYLNGFIAICVTAVYLGTGWFFAHHVFRTEYSFRTDKPLGQEKLRIVLIADTHLGITLHESEMEELVSRINDDEPDLVVICGDFVDDDSGKDDMLGSCEALGRLRTKYGVYFNYGNHDKGYFNGRDFDADDLEEALRRNNVTLLCDESLLINNSFYLVGRKDRSDDERLSAKELTRELDKSKYIIMLDHQPNDYDNEAETGADLVLSGHTHGGHIFPIGPISLLIGANDQVYGQKVQNGTRFVVTSGASGWAIPFKTFAILEYVVIDIESIGTSA